jgi:hypothetical protein
LELEELEAFTVGRCLVDHLGRRIKGLVRITEYFPFGLYFDRLVDRRRINNGLRAKTNFRYWLRGWDFFEQSKRFLLESRGFGIEV